MVRVPEGYCIDSTEVTRDQYQAWLNTNPSLSLQHPTNCGFNTTFEPQFCTTEDGYACQGSDCGKLPQVCVDWCDAYAYCAGVGKRLCGKIGGGSLPFSGSDNASDQWGNACASGSANSTYPYGNTYDGSACNGYDNNVGTPVSVASMSSCQSPILEYQGVYDLSGNVSEWVDSCEVATQCHTRGGAFDSANSVLTCGVAAYPYITEHRLDTGFRCCFDEGTCQTFYLDEDGDGHGSEDPATSIQVCGGVSPPVGYVNVGDDCCDNGGDLVAAAKIFAGQTEFFTTPAGVCGIEWDYDCDGVTLAYCPMTGGPVAEGAGCGVNCYLMPSGVCGAPAMTCMNCVSGGNPATCGAAAHTSFCEDQNAGYGICSSPLMSWTFGCR